MTDKPQPMIQYSGMQVAQTRERIQITISVELPHGAKAGLRKQGFKRQSDSVWDAPYSSRAIMAAQAIGSTFFSEDKS